MGADARRWVRALHRPWGHSFGLQTPPAKIGIRPTRVDEKGALRPAFQSAQPVKGNVLQVVRIR